MVISGISDKQSEILLDYSGSGNTHINADMRQLHLKLTGSGNVTAKGTAKKVIVESSGSGKLSLFDLKAQYIKVYSYGSGIMEVSAEKNLDVELTGSGSVQYKGKPTVHKDISGLGTV